MLCENSNEIFTNFQHPEQFISLCIFLRGCKTSNPADTLPLGLRRHPTPQHHTTPAPHQYHTNTTPAPHQHHTSTTPHHITPAPHQHSTTLCSATYKPCTQCIPYSITHIGTCRTIHREPKTLSSYRLATCLLLVFSVVRESFNTWASKVQSTQRCGETCFVLLWKFKMQKL
jgi:hypothetical protein